MHKSHTELLQLIKASASGKVEAEINERYHGNTHYYYGLKVPVKRQLTKLWMKAHPDWKTTDWVHFLDSLYQGKSYEEKTMAGSILELLGPKVRRQISFQDLEKWLTLLVGWAEIDSTCQSTFTAKEVLENWTDWEKFLKKLNVSKEISHRRASLVILCKSVGQSADPRLAKLALANIAALKYEKDILITKAISWLLRSMTKHFAQEVMNYLERELENLPKIAVRETRRKLETGRK